jgi:hypothetical protein
MSDRKSLADSWMEFQPTKTMTFWSCAAVAVATMAIGFGAGGWVTGGTAGEMAQNASEKARAELVASACVEKYAAHDTFATDLAALKEASSWKQGDIVAEGGWATLAGMKEPLDDAARLCANKLVAMDAPVADAKPVVAAATTPGS